MLIILLFLSDILYTYLYLAIIEPETDKYSNYIFQIIVKQFFRKFIKFNSK
jgi:hypothetical protein